MAESAPGPSPSFSGIDFNPSFFPSTTSDYLEFPVAQGTETFGTIYTTTIDTPTPDSDFDFLDSSLANINIGTSVPSLKKIKLGANTGTTVQCGSIDCTGTAINNAVDYLGGDLSLGAGQTTGILNLGTGFRTTTGNGGGINIGTLATGAIPITIGTTGKTTTTLRGTSVDVTTKITAPTVDSSAAATSMTIGDNLRGGSLSLGGGSGHTGAINIGLGQTTGVLNIGTGSRTNSAIINIGTAAALDANMGILIGTPSRTYTTLYGTDVGVETQMSAPIINAKTTSTAMTIGANLMDGTLTIGGTTQTGDISLAAGQTSGDLYIGTGSRTATADINIGTGSNAAGNIYIGHKTGIVSTQAVKINTSSTAGASGATTIGSSTSSTTIGGALSVSGAITADGGLTIPSGDTLTVTGSIGGAGSISTTGTIQTSNSISTTGTGAITSAGTMTSGGLLTANASLTVTGTTTSTSCASATYNGPSGNITAMTVGGNQTTGSITIGGAQTTGDINIGTNSTSDIYIGNVASGTAVNTGICHINKLQVGGAGTGSIFRCMIIKLGAGAGAGSGTETITGAPTTLGNPIIFTQISDAGGNLLFSIGVSVTGTSAFSWTKNFIGYAGSSITASGTASAQSFNYLAVWV